MTGAVTAVVIGIGSIPIVWVSRRSLRHPRSHGVYRFFAFEAILVILVLNAPWWFAHPFSPRQLVSWPLLCLSGLSVVWSVVLFHRVGRPVTPPRDSPLIGWEYTSELVTQGIYRYIRHPMYGSLLFLAWGAALKTASSTSLTLAVLATVSLYATARVEETENIARWGERYRDYMEGTRRFIPFVW